MTEKTSELILAPIRGITDVVYRNAVAECMGGFDRAMAPFIQLRRGRDLRPGEQRRVDPANNQRLPTIPQIHTNDPQSFIAGLHALHQLGHHEVNWNLGCPWPRVSRRKHGAGLLPYPRRIQEILDTVIPAAPVRLSIKMRLGRDHPDEFLAVIDVLNQFPLSEVILHARTATQLYEGTVDLDRAVLAAAMCKHPFVYNGDILDWASFRQTQDKLAGVTRWMLGRGALWDPFLPACIKGAPRPSPDACLNQIRLFHGRLYAGYREYLSGPSHLLNKMKEQWGYLCHAFRNPQLTLHQITRKTDEASYLEAVAGAFQPQNLK